MQKRSFAKSFAAAFLGLSLLFLTSGCELFDAGGKAVKFSAASNIVTKAVYGGDTEDGKFQQIIWENGDPIRIFSAQAITNNNEYYADYTVSRAGDNGRYSYGKLNAPEAPLMWDDAWTSGYEFWAMYPASAGTSMTGFSFDGYFTANIPDDGYLMVAHSNAAYGQSKVVLEFYPAFTAFRINVASDVDGVTINSLSLTSSETPLTGTFAAKIATNVSQDGQGIEYYVPSADASYSATSTLVEDKENGVRSFVIFCLPGTLSHLTLHCNYTQNGEAKTKKLKLQDGGGSWMYFSACKQHRMDLTLKASEGGDIHFDLSIGGCQMILSILADQLTQWEGEGMDIAMRKFGMDPDNSSGWWDGTHQDFWDFWNALQNKPINYFNQFVSNVDKTNPPDCRVVFDSSNGYFSATELEIIRDFLLTVTEYTHKTSLSESIYAYDFQYIPNIQKIKQEELDSQTVHAHNDAFIEIEGLSSLLEIDLHKWPNVIVKNCPSLTQMKVTNTTDVPTYVTVENCPALTQFTADGSGPEIHYSFSNMSALTSLTLNDAGSLSVSNCPAFREFSFWTANNLTAISLSNTPAFQTGTSYNTEKTVAVSLDNCSTYASGATITLRGNGNATNAGKVNSDNVKVQFIDNGGNVKAEF